MAVRISLYIQVAIGCGVAVLLYFLWPRPVATPRPIPSAPCGGVTMELVNEADLVITGTVFAVLPFESKAQVLIEADRVYRGQVPSRGVNIITDRSGTAAADPQTDARNVQFRTGDDVYLMYLKQRPDGRYEPVPCGTRLLGSGLTADEDLYFGEGQAVDEGVTGGIH